MLFSLVMYAGLIQKFWSQEVLVLPLHLLRPVVGYPRSQAHPDALHHLHAVLDLRIAVHLHLEAALALHLHLQRQPLTRHHHPATVTSHLLHLWVEVHRLHLRPHLLPHPHLLQPLTFPLALAAPLHLLLLPLVEEEEDEEPYWRKFVVDVC